MPTKTVVDLSTGAVSQVELSGAEVADAVRRTAAEKARQAAKKKALTTAALADVLVDKGILSRSDVEVKP